MEKREASRSASFIAAHRAMESFRNPEDRVCVDPFARRLLPAGFTVIGPSAIPEETALNIFRDFVPGFHEFFIARTRYIDDRLQALIDGGLEQLVILGAGYDSRAYRFDALKTHIKVFEVDHPATQRVKKEKLLEIFRVLPRHVTYIPVDFRDAELGACLFDHGYDRCLKTLFILEGVLMYVAPGAVDETLAFISANTAKGSAVIFDYTYPEVLAGTCDRKEARQWLEVTSKSDEPLLFGIRSEDLAQFLAERGFCNFTSVTSDYFSANYFTGANSGREATPIFSIVHAEVGR